MELLIVGAGAVGSAYGYLASRSKIGDAPRITFFVKPKHRKELRDGIRLYRWQGRKAEEILFTDFSLLDSPDELRTRKFDAVLITLPSDRFRASEWLENFLAGLNAGSPDAKIWSLQPAENDQRFLREKLGESFAIRAVRGQIPIMSYLAPLPGESFEKPGYAFYAPKAAKAKWSSPNEAAAREAADFFESGGLSSKVVNDRTRPADLFPEALLRAVVAGLERSEWSFDRLVNGEHIHLVTGGMRELTAISAKSLGTEDPGLKWWGKIASSPAGVAFAIRLARKIIPFDFEAFMRIHFTKVENQMHLTLDEQIEYGKKNGLSTTNLTLLRGRKKQTTIPKKTEA